MKEQELVEKIVKSLVKDQDAISVKTFEGNEEEAPTIEVLIKEEDMGRVIGKGGKTAHAIRTLVQACSAINNHKYVKVNFDKF